MTIRRARKPLTGAVVADVRVLLGEDKDGRRIVSLRPSGAIRSGISNLDDAADVHSLIVDLERAARFLEEGDS